MHPMSRLRNSIPSYLLHSQSGRARAVWTDPTGIRRFRLLPGAHDSTESRSAFARLLLELDAAPHQPQVTDPDGITIAELLLKYLDHAERHYRTPDGRPTSEIFEVRVVIRALRELYAYMFVRVFGPLCVKAARQKWINEGRSRTECNRRVSLIKRILKWAVSEELAPPAVYHAVAAVAGLQKGRTKAPEKPPVGPVADAMVDATLPYLNRHVRGLVEFQRLTGCRPGEACGLRRCDIDTSEEVWLYTPPHHKTAWRGKGRIIAVGPRAQELIREFFTEDPQGYLFSPRRAVEEQLAQRSEMRKTPRWPSHMKRNAAKRERHPKRPPSEKYNTQNYGLAIDRACDRAFPPPGVLAQQPGESAVAWWSRLTTDQKEQMREWQKAHRWHPNQLRHSFAMGAHDREQAERPRQADRSLGRRERVTPRQPVARTAGRDRSGRGPDQCPRARAGRAGR
jgi:integrase